MDRHRLNSPIVIVEDDISNAKLLTVILQGENYHVKAAHDGNEALKLLLTTRPQAIIIDLVLPGMSGLVLADKIKKNPKTKDIPLVAVTAYDSFGTEKMSRSAGCVGYYRKPIDVLSFPKQLKNHISKENT